MLLEKWLYNSDILPFSKTFKGEGLALKDPNVVYEKLVHKGFLLILMRILQDIVVQKSIEDWLNEPNVVYKKLVHEGFSLILIRTLQQTLLRRKVLRIDWVTILVKFDFVIKLLIFGILQKNFNILLSFNGWCALTILLLYKSPSFFFQQRMKTYGSHGCVEDGFSVWKLETHNTR